MPICDMILYIVLSITEGVLFLIIEMNFDFEAGKVAFMKKLDSGIKQRKVVDMNEFLQKYTTFLKEKEDNFKFLYFPAGTVEYFKNTASSTIIVHTYGYEDYYGIEDKEKSYLIKMDMNLMCNKVRSAQVYSTKGAFNKHFSRFIEIYRTEDNISVVDEDDAVKKIIAIAISELESRKKILSLKKKYNDII